MYIHIYMYIHTYVYIYIYVYIYTPTSHTKTNARIHTGDWDIAPLSLALIESAGRSLCFLHTHIVVTPTLSSPRLLGQLASAQVEFLGKVTS